MVVQELQLSEVGDQHGHGWLLRCPCRHFVECKMMVMRLFFLNLYDINANDLMSECADCVIDE